MLNDLFQSDDGGWLQDAAVSAFPSGTRLRRLMVPPGSGTAIVDLSVPGPADGDLAGMAAQLVWTLASTSYMRQPIEAVRLDVNGKPWSPPGATDVVQSLGAYPQPALDPRSHQFLYYLNSQGAARMIRGPGSPAAVVPGDVLVGDDEGVIVIPAALVDEVLADAERQEHEDAWVAERVADGAPVDGLFPMDAAWRARYEAAHRER